MHRSYNKPVRRYSKSKDVLSEEQIMKNLLALLTSTNYNMVQENGQRKYGGPCPNWDQPNPPPSDCEIFISQIPDTCFEDVLVPIFASVGKIYEMRLMLDFDGSHRGFAYIKYTCVEHANEAIRRLDKFKLPMSARPLRVTVSRNSCEVEVTNLIVTNNLNFETMVKDKTAAVSTVRWTEPTKVIIAYETHRDAAIARRFLLSTLPDIFGPEVRVQLVRKSIPAQGYVQKKRQTDDYTMKKQGYEGTQPSYTSTRHQPGPSYGQNLYVQTNLPPLSPYYAMPSPAWQYQQQFPQGYAAHGAYFHPDQALPTPQQQVDGCSWVN